MCDLLYELKHINMPFPSFHPPSTFDAQNSKSSIKYFFSFSVNTLSIDCNSLLSSISIHITNYLLIRFMASSSDRTICVTCNKEKITNRPINITTKRQSKVLSNEISFLLPFENGKLKLFEFISRNLFKREMSLQHNH